MRFTKVQRIATLILALSLLLGGATFTAAADGGESGSTSTESASINSYLARVNADAYNTYLSKHADAESGTQTITVNALDYDPEKTTAAVSEVEYEGVTALHTPGIGNVVWSVDLAGAGVTGPALYNMLIDYYPEVGKSAAIERELYLNGKTPFVEALSVKLPKLWENEYLKGTFTAKSEGDAQNAKAKAAELGIEAEVDGKTVSYTIPACWTEDTAKYLLVDNFIRFFRADINGNELRPTVTQTPGWTTFVLHDTAGYYSATRYKIYLDPGASGKVELQLSGKNESMAIKSIRFVPCEEPGTYADYKAMTANAIAGRDVIKIEAEYPSAISSNTIYPVEDRTSAATSPSDVTRTVLNTIGGEKWQTAGQWVEYKFKVGSSGMYKIFSRFKQSILDGIYTSRSLYIYSGDGVAAGQLGYYNGIPFEEAAALRFNYNTEWQAYPLTNYLDGDNDGKIDEFMFYFKENVEYTIRFEVTLGNMGPIIQNVESILAKINNDYLTILKLTGANPDSYRDYGFARVMPDTLIDMIIQSRALYEVIDYMKATAGTASSEAAILQKVAILLQKMGTDEDQIATQLDSLKSYVGSIGTFLSDSKTQPLTFDYLMVVGCENENYKVKSKAGFFESVWHEIRSFFVSFWRDYNSMGATDTSGIADNIEVWVAYGRDQSQVIRNLITNDFTPNNNVAADLKLVSGGTLLPSILANKGPDVYLGLGQGDVINYAIRGALHNIEEMEGFEETTGQFTEAAMLVLGIADAKNVKHYYGLPETQGFSMMFVRVDVLSNLGIEIPKTWEDIYSALPILEANSMEVGVTTDFQIFLYQKGGELFADDGMRINLDSQLGLESFETMCNMFTQYSFPYTYSAPNRFRTGEMPIVLADYCGMYNQLKVFATEIEGLWEFVPVPGTLDEEGNINNCAISSVSADVIVTGSRNPEAAWKYLKWYTGPECQTAYANDMVAIIGDSAKHPTANRTALASMPWTTAEYEQVAAQFNNLAAVPNYPGAYIIGRYTGFAFLAAYNKGANPITELLSYINTINKEITRKRKEFGLETLEIGQTLASKRLDMATELLNTLSKTTKDYDDMLPQVRIAIRNMEGVKSHVETKHIVLLESYADYFSDEAARLDPTGAAVKADAEKNDRDLKDIASICARIGKYLQEAADAFKTY